MPRRSLWQQLTHMASKALAAGDPINKIFRCESYCGTLKWGSHFTMTLLCVGIIEVVISTAILRCSFTLVDYSFRY